MQKSKCKNQNFNLEFKIFYFLSVFFLPIFLFLPVEAEAAIGVSPERLELEVERDATVEQKLFVDNLNQFPVRVLIQSPNNESITFDKQELIMPPRSREEILVTAVAKKHVNSEVEIIAFEGTGEQLTIQSGIIIPINIGIKSNYRFFLALGVVVLLGVLLLIYRKKKHLSHPPD